MSATSRHLAVRVNHDHLRGLTRCHPSVGIAELIWNSLDADANKVSVWLRDGPMEAIEVVEVNDDGTGIDVLRVDDAFQVSVWLRESWVVHGRQQPRCLAKVGSCTAGPARVDFAPQVSGVICTGTPSIDGSTEQSMRSGFLSARMTSLT